MPKTAQKRTFSVQQGLDYGEYFMLILSMPKIDDCKSYYSFISLQEHKRPLKHERMLFFNQSYQKNAYCCLTELKSNEYHWSACLSYS